MRCCSGVAALVNSQLSMIQACRRMELVSQCCYSQQPKVATSCRRAERREDAVAMLRSRGYGREVDLSPAESEGTFLEGTGVLVRPGT